MDRINKLTEEKQILEYMVNNSVINESFEEANSNLLLNSLDDNMHKSVWQGDKHKQRPYLDKQ